MMQVLYQNSIKCTLYNPPSKTQEIMYSTEKGMVVPLKVDGNEN
jgi:hypothetical protein